MTIHNSIQMAKIIGEPLPTYWRDEWEDKRFKNFK